MSAQRTEGARRLRAMLRAALSPAVWLLIGVQLLHALVRRFGVAGQEQFSPQVLLYAMGVALLMLLVFYLQGGIYQRLARAREPVAIGEALRAGHQVFPRFIWLTIKAGLLLGAVLAATLLLAQMVLGLEPKQLVESRATPLLFVILPFALVWWLPWVFVHERFGLRESLRAALQRFWREVPRSGFLAVLILVPGSLVLLLPAGVPFVVALALDVLTVLLVWMAGVYCVERLADEGAAPAATEQPDIS
jgi:hypothetical protein